MTVPRRLTVHDHDRRAAGLTYVYPVVSRRAGGLSIGINLNPDAKCNWRCAYCQVPGLGRGTGPAVDLALLARELDSLLTDVVEGDTLARTVPEPYRRLADVAFSGDGEPTSSPHFAEATALVLERLAAWQLLGSLPIVIITNGTFVRRPRVSAALARLADARGELWFKLDAGTRAGFATINGVGVEPETHLARLVHASRLCPTWVQTCLFSRDGAGPAPETVDAYVAAQSRALERGARIVGVHLYTLARPSHQPGGERLGALPEATLEGVADRLRALGLTVRVSG